LRFGLRFVDKQVGCVSLRRNATVGGSMRNICAFDGKEFEAMRSDARYCSAACRAKASKARRREEGQSVGIAQATSEPEALEPADDSGELEERVANLEGDLELIEAQVLSRSSDKQLLELVRRELHAVVAPMAQRLQAVEKIGAQLRTAVETTTRAMSTPQATTDIERVDDIEEAVITLAHRVNELRADFEALGEGIASLGSG
jgi:hypothetical protein